MADNSLNALRAFSIGFDPLFNALETLTHNQQTFPPYTIVQVDETKYVLELALAGYTKSDVEMTLKDGLLVVSAEKKDRQYGTTKTVKRGELRLTYPMELHSGISYRAFSKSFKLGENTEVKNAYFENGLLIVELEQRIPEEKKTKTISIK